MKYMMILMQQNAITLNLVNYQRIDSQWTKSINGRYKWGENSIPLKEAYVLIYHLNPPYSMLQGSKSKRW